MSDKLKILNLYFATHKTCNMNCRYCYLPEYNRYSTKLSDDEILKSLSNLIKKFENEEYQIGAFCLHGSEPSLLSATALGEIVLMINGHWNKNEIKDFNVAIQSNGKRFTEDYLLEVLKVIKKPELLRLGFSIDPPKQVHDFLRDKSYNAVIENYNTATEMGFPVSVLSVVTKKTLEHLVEFGYWMIEQLKMKEETGNPYKVKIKFATGDMALNHEDMIQFSNFLIEENLLSLPQILSPGYCIQSGNDCLWYEFDVEGNCYSCNKSYNNDGVFADWTMECLKDIVTKRKKLYINYNRNEECESCPYEIICNSGCPLDREKLGVMAGKAHECSMIKHVLEHVLYDTKEHITEFYNKNI
ncbi:MAG: radical SAM protein [bacterium]